jgi:D-amino-acid oxidase
MSDNSVSLSRRSALHLMAAGAAGLALPAASSDALAHTTGSSHTHLRNGEILGTPDFGNRQRLGLLAGVRPYRPEGVRLETQRLAEGKFLIHNYGHGGAGITLSWGCAADVDRRVKALIAQRAVQSGKSIGIIGSGVCGLTVATELRKSFPRTRIVIYTRDAVRDTTSYVAGGQFSPSGMTKPYERRLRELHALVKASHAKIQEYRRNRTARTYGIAVRNNYSFTRHGSFDIGMPCDVVPQPRTGLLPFANLNTVNGWEYETFVLNPMIMLPALQRDLERSRMVTFQRTTVTLSRIADLHRTTHDIIINCSGMGAQNLVNDRTLTPIKGQLVRLRNPAQLKYFFSESCSALGADATYLFCRQDDIVVGGTYEVGLDNRTPVVRETNAFLDRMKNLFTGSTRVCIDPNVRPVQMPLPAHRLQCPSPGT